MTYQETLDFLFSALPMYQRMGAVAMKADLVNTYRLCEHLGHPHSKFKSIHVGGTNGKGSTSHALASVLQEAGFKVGLYTSPHLKSFRERIKINGEEIPEENIVAFVAQHQAFLEALKPSFFEMTVGMAFGYFAEEKVDYAVVEVGLGGRLDSTNVLHPELCVITNIGLDHVEFLGNTLSKIAWEKAGIIKEGVPVIISETQQETTAVFGEVARQQMAPIYFADHIFKIELLPFENADGQATYQVGHERGKHVYHMDLLGSYQQKNLAGILQAIDVLREQGLNIREEAIKAGLGRITKNTGIKGRWQKLGENPLVYCDTGHNSEAFRMLLDQINGISHNNLFFVLGMSKDKDVGAVLTLFPKEAQYIFCEAHIPRAMSAEELGRKARIFGLEGEVVPDVNQALKKALSIAGKDDLVFVGGSTFVVAELENL